MKGAGNLVVVAVAVLLGGGAGCGDDDPSAGDYREDANAICAQGRRALEGLAAPTTPEGFGRYFRRLQERTRKYDRDFASLEPPEELREQHEKVVRLSKEGERLVNRLAADLKSGTPPIEAIRENIPALERIGHKSNALAKRMGLPKCVTPLGVPSDEPAPS